MPVTFNSNNNYDVEIITEANVTNPTIVQYSATTNTPFVEIKITPTNSQLNPVLASNLKIDNIVPDFAWNAGVNYNVKGICEPPATPHGANSSMQHVTGIGVTSYCQTTFGINSFFGNSNEPQQGPYSAQNEFSTQTSQIAANGVSWSEIVLIEVYEDDLAELINDQHSPAIAENYNEWLMWSGPVSTPGGMRREITTNIYPIYVKAFVYLSFDGNGLAGLTANTTLNLDIDEVEPVYGCTDSLANNYSTTATIDNGSCAYPLSEYTVELVVSVSNNQGFVGPYTDGSMYIHNSSSYTTVDFDETANPNGNIQLGSGAISQTITLPDTYQAGVLVQYTEVFYIYPSVGYGGFNVYNYPFAGSGQGPNGNISQAPGYSQRMYYGWGNTKNNLTAASLRIQQPFTYVWESPMYIDPNDVNYAPIYSEWHNNVDPTGLQPTQFVNFNNFDAGSGITITNSVTVLEIYQANPALEQFEWFPEKLKVTVDLNFIMPTPQGGTTLSIPINLYHNTENQGDLNWTTPI